VFWNGALWTPGEQVPVLLARDCKPMRTPCMTRKKMPMFVWSWLITAMLLLAAIPVLPAFDVFSQITPTFARKPLFGYISKVYRTATIAFLPFIVWAHHMYTVGMPLAGEPFFMCTTMMPFRPA